MAVAGGVGAAMVGGAALSSGCYDPVDVTVFDGVTGLRACDARVVARSTEGANATFLSCFHAELPVGTWTVSAERLGYEPVSAQLVVGKGRRCEPAVQSIEISMLPLGVARAAPVAVRPPRPGEAPIAPGTLPPPASIAGEHSPPAASVPAPPPGPAAVSSSTAPSAAPAAPPAPPVGAAPPAPQPTTTASPPVPAPAGSAAPGSPMPSSPSR